MDASYPVRRKLKARSGLTNGKTLLAGIDGRSKWARRLHDLIANHVAELGGQSNVTQSQYILVKSAANATIVLEQWEVEFAKASTASLPELLAYQSIVNSLRRTFETLGLNRVEPPPTTKIIMDLNKLTEAEQNRFKTLMERHDKFGLERLSEDQLRELQILIAKGSGRGTGPSAKDASYRDRAFHELDLSRQ